MAGKTSTGSAANPPGSKIPATRSAPAADAACTSWHNLTHLTSQTDPNGYGAAAVSLTYCGAILAASAPCYGNAPDACRPTADALTRNDPATPGYPLAATSKKEEPAAAASTATRTVTSSAWHVLITAESHNVPVNGHGRAAASPCAP